MFKDKKEKLETEHEEREKIFLEKLNENHESSLSRLSDAHQEKIALMERQYLQQKQQVLKLSMFRNLWLFYYINLTTKFKNCGFFFMNHLFIFKY